MTMPGASPYRQLEPGIWRSLLARAAIYHATRGKLGRLCDMADLPAVKLVLLQLDLSAQHLSQQDADDQTFVTSVVDAWAAIIAHTMLQSVEPETVKLLTELKELARSARSDDPFRAIFASVESQARHLYGPAWRPATLSVAHARSHPRSGSPTPDPYAVTATTPWPPDPVGAEIELHIYCDKFGPAAFAAVPMLLTHECVCHVAARQDRARNDSAFAEGFLDWAAYHFFGMWAGKLDPQMAPAARKHAERLKQVLTARSETKEGRARLVGHGAAEDLRVWFEVEYGWSSDESQTQAARLAVELNKVDRPLAAKDHFGSMLSWPLPPNVARALDQWVDGTIDTGQLLDVG